MTIILLTNQTNVKEQYFLFKQNISKTRDLKIIKIVCLKNMLHYIFMYMWAYKSSKFHLQIISSLLKKFMIKFYCCIVLKMLWIFYIY
jgi:hypothetical protein